ncbi:hypothetical protein [Bacillus paramycoides]|uniref:Uncharacterized protein n=1 Tax=Bacillus paramycoides TaxID=2026194 RepID=A0ABU6N556_9BACI|nr:hypothetical protein [Bacillus paramycoides]
MMKALLIIFLPLIGIILGLYLFKPVKPAPVLQRKKEDQSTLPAENEEDENFYQTINIESEMNIVPIQDALILNDNKTKRKLLIQSLKENSVGSTKVLEKALENEDSETSHYAATAIMEMKRKFLNSMRDLALQLEEHPDDVRVLSAYAEKMNQYLKSTLLDEGTYRQYQSILSDILEKLLEAGQGHKQYYIEKINCDLGLMDFDKAGYYSEKFLKDYPHEEMAYIMALKLHYIGKNPTQLQKVIMSLKNHPVRLSAEGLSIIRFWL